ncbi:MAG TPA: hypothetical protein H9707_07670, partial [Candidatus Butyricicoccus avicola]|nr:hypothetical protein [Candidatus Butyricicoccus avicola]
LCDRISVLPAALADRPILLVPPAVSADAACQPYHAPQNAHWGVFFSLCTAAQNETALPKNSQKIFSFSP